MIILACALIASGFWLTAAALIVWLVGDGRER